MESPSIKTDSEDYLTWTQPAFVWTVQAGAGGCDGVGNVFLAHFGRVLVSINHHPDATADNTSTGTEHVHLFIAIISHYLMAAPSMITSSWTCFMNMRMSSV